MNKKKNKKNTAAKLVKKAGARPAKKAASPKAKRKAVSPAKAFSRIKQSTAIPLIKAAAKKTTQKNADARALRTEPKPVSVPVQPPFTRPAPAGRSQYAAPFIPEPPHKYDVTRLVLLARDPEWAYAYWEITEHSIQQALQTAGQENYRRMLRVYDVTDVVFNGSNAHKTFDLEIGPYASSWYLKMPEPDRTYLAEIGIMTPGGKFISIARSNTIHLPRMGASNVLDEEWATINFDELFRMSGGLGPLRQGIGSAFVVEEFSRRMIQEMQMGSGAVSSFSGPKGEKQKNFWLKVGTELILYGATEPDASLSVQGVPVKLNPDGTFSLRFALPDGMQVFPVKALSKDGSDSRTITPVVKKTTEGADSEW